MTELFHAGVKVTTDTAEPATPRRLTVEEREAIRARADAATVGYDGTWYVSDDREPGDVYRIAYDDLPRYFGCYLTAAKPLREELKKDGDAWEGGLTCEADAQFIAHARADVPALLAHAESMDAERECAEARLADLTNAWREEKAKREAGQAE